MRNNKEYQDIITALLDRIAFLYAREEKRVVAKKSHTLKEKYKNTATSLKFIVKEPQEMIPKINQKPMITPTPNLTIYYPLKSSILSVSIRFMGLLLLVFGFLAVSVFLILNLFHVSFGFLNLIFLFNTLILISTSVYHVMNSISHYITKENSPIEDRAAIIYYISVISFAAWWTL